MEFDVSKFNQEKDLHMLMKGKMLSVGALDGVCLKALFTVLALMSVKFSLIRVSLLLWINQLS